jgi:hypothetical protein
LFIGIEDTIRLPYLDKDSSSLSMVNPCSDRTSLS